MTMTDEQIAALSEAELRALRDLLDRMIPVAAAVERGGADISLTIERGAAAAFITLSTEVEDDHPF